jgi:hypothetical protein
MKQRRAAVAGRGIRVARGLWPDRNPLRRTLDRVEAAIMAGLAVAFVAGVPLAAVAAGQLTDSIGSRIAHEQQSVRHHVPAVLLAPAPNSGYVGYMPEVRARWTAPDGAQRTGAVPALPSQRAGTTVMVWTDAAGHLTERPLTVAQVHDQAVMAAIVTAIVLGVVLWCTGELAHYLLGRRRLAAWDAEWRAIGPQWTTRR